MRKGNLVKLKSTIYHQSGAQRPGLLGVVVGVFYPTAYDARKQCHVVFGSNTVTCHWHELEVLSESR